MGSNPDELVQSAISQGVGSALLDALLANKMAVPETLRRYDENARFARASSTAVLSVLEEVFSKADIPWVALKGVVVGALYRNPQLRSFADIDVLIRGCDMGSAIEAMEGVSIRNVNRNWGNYLTYGIAETPLWAPGIAIDLHWHVIGLAKQRNRTNIDIAGMISRRKKISIGSCNVWTLDPEDTLLHVCIHAAGSGARRLLWLKDVTEIVNAEKHDWTELLTRAKQTGLGAQIGQVLDRARCLLEIDVPLWVLSELTSSYQLQIRRWLDSRERGRGLPDRFAPGFPVHMSKEGILPSTIAAIESGVHRFIPGPSFNVGDPGGPLYWDNPSGGPEARSAYLDYAEEASRLHGE
ncbi:MAG: nucleotidyltransferase domain-containing protein [Pseudomonadales bacterium]